MPKKTKSIRLSPALWQKGKIQAITEGKTLEVWISEAIREKLANSQKSPIKPSVTGRKQGGQG